MTAGSLSKPMNKIFPASLDRLYEMLHFIREQAAIAEFDESKISKIELAVEETVVNIVTYGYPKRNGIIEINCSPSIIDGIKIIIKDKGIPYNPLTNTKKFDPTATLENRDIGGYGIFLILKIMDEVDYKRVENYNVLTLTKFKN